MQPPSPQGAGLVVQRGENNNFPRMALVAMASTSSVPPGSLSLVEYDPTTYAGHDDPVGPRRQFFWDDPTQPRPDTDWRVLTVGFNSNSSAGQPGTVQVAVDNVLIGVRCNEQDWQAPSIAGC